MLPGGKNIVIFLTVNAKQGWLNNVFSHGFLASCWSALFERFILPLLLASHWPPRKCLKVISGFQYLISEYYFDNDKRRKSKSRFGKHFFEIEFTKIVSVRFLCPLQIIIEVWRIFSSIPFRVRRSFSL